MGRKVIETEAHVKQKIIKPWYTQKGAWSFMPVSNGLGRHGIPDHIGVVPITITPDMVGKVIGQAVLIEAKSPKKAGTCSARQYHEITEARKAGAIATVVGNEAELELVDEIIERFTYEADYVPTYPFINIDKSRK